jgi:diamine N-acetyltransferase
MTDLRLRGFQPNDLDMIESLWSNPETARLICNRVSHPSQARIIQHFSESTPDNNRLIIADADNIALGYASYRQLCAVSRIYRIGLSLLPSSRGLGAGTKSLYLLESLLQSSWMAHKLQAEVISDNEASHRLFKRSGYRIVGTMRSHYLLQDCYYDVVIYEKIL